MIHQEQEQLIYDIISRQAQFLNLELVEVKMARHNKDVLIQILADTSEGGISLGACTLLNHSIVEAIDKEAILSEDGYSLEVSSPGLDRPLVNFKDFLRNINREIHVWLKERLAGKLEYEGVVTSVTQENLTLLTSSKVKTEIIIPIGQIVKGLLVI